METQPSNNDTLQLPDPPPFPGLVFRHFRGEIDYPGMVEVVNIYNAGIKEEWVETVQTLADEYSQLVRSNAFRDLIVAEVNGRLVGYTRSFWWEELDGPFIYSAVTFLLPEFRGYGIGRAMVRWIEERQREIAAGHPAEKPKFFQRYVNGYDTWLRPLVESEGYSPLRYFFHMRRPSLDDIPDFPLPEGIELRPVLPEHYPLIWEAEVEAFGDHWGFGKKTEEDYEQWLNYKTTFQPELWQIGWDTATNEIAGQVRTIIDWAANEQFGRARGYTENISVRRPWRRRGLARALIAESLRVQKARGMTESALGVDSDSLTGATRVYEACGFRTVRQDTLYRKAL